MACFANCDEIGTNGKSTYTVKTSLITDSSVTDALTLSLKPFVEKIASLYGLYSQVAVRETWVTRKYFITFEGGARGRHFALQELSTLLEKLRTDAGCRYFLWGPKEYKWKYHSAFLASK